MIGEQIYLNGRVVPVSKAAVSLFDIGILRGYAVFDLLRTVGRRPFLLAEHLRRFRASAAELDLRVPESDETIAEVIGMLLEANGHAEATVRLVLTGGVSPDGMSYDPDSPTFFIATQDLHEPPAELYERGGALITHDHRRQFPAAKTTNYLTMVKHRDRCAAAGAIDVLYHDSGTVSEPATASFYIVRGTTITAPADGVLWGTTGTYVLSKVAQRFPVIAEDFTLEEVFSADEAFLTSTTRGVVPIVTVDGRPVGDGTVGPVTTELMAIYRSATTPG